jgi:hypothetical protein
MMLRRFCLIFGIVFILLGIAGFIPPLTRHHWLSDVFEVSSVRNLIYILTGLIGLSTSTSAGYAKLYFKIFGLIYALMAIFGFALNGNLGLLHVNLADSFFHLIVAIIALYLGFTCKIPTSSYH